MELMLVAFNFPNYFLFPQSTTIKKKRTNKPNRFLKGACDKKPCLLSHDTTLSKMPTCRFYLRGMCFKTDCPYLHKKVNDKTEICVDFLRGFCGKADQVRTTFSIFHLTIVSLIFHSILLAFYLPTLLHSFHGHFDLVYKTSWIHMSWTTD